jgi:hypothetical protein
MKPQITIRNFVMLLHVSAPTGHPRRGHLQRNTFIINAAKDVHIRCKVKMRCYQLKIGKVVYRM